MQKSKINLWPLLPVAIIVAAFLAAQFMPDAVAEKPGPEDSSISKSL